jgi:hypothetical protein
MTAMSLVAIGGCSGKSGSAGVKLKGQLVQNGQPVQPAQNDYYQIVLIPESGLATNTYPATPPGSDGTFSIDGPDGRGVPAGKYKVTVKNMVQSPRGGLADKFNNRYDERNTQLTWDVTSDTSVHKVEIGK